jgi:hypothetical protein
MISTCFLLFLLALAAECLVSKETTDACGRADLELKIKHVIPAWPSPTALIKSKTNALSMPITDANIRFYYNEWMSRKLEDAETRQLLRQSIGKFILISQFYVPDSEEKTNEILASLQMNLLSPFVDSVHLLQETADMNNLITDTLALADRKVKITVIGKRLSFLDAVIYSNRLNVAEHQLVAVANIDDIFSSLTIVNLASLQTLSLKKTLFFISRLQSFEADSISYTFQRKKINRNFCFERFLSSDVFIFSPPMELVEEIDLDIKLGTEQIEQFLSFQILNHLKGWSVANICPASEIYHNHRHRSNFTGKTIIEKKASSVPKIYWHAGLPSRNHSSYCNPTRHTNSSLNCMYSPKK